MMYNLLFRTAVRLYCVQAGPGELTAFFPCPREQKTCPAHSQVFVSCVRCRLWGFRAGDDSTWILVALSSCATTDAFSFLASLKKIAFFGTDCRIANIRYVFASKQECFLQRIVLQHPRRLVGSRLLFELRTVLQMSLSMGKWDAE